MFHKKIIFILFLFAVGNSILWVKSNETKGVMYRIGESYMTMTVTAEQRKITFDLYLMKLIAVLCYFSFNLLGIYRCAY